MVEQEGWAGLFASAFKESRNAMVLLDSHRIQVDVNGAYLTLLGYRRDRVLGRPISEFVLGGPAMSAQQWARALSRHHFNGEARLVCSDGDSVGVQWAATVEVLTGHRRILFVALSTSRWGSQFRRPQLLERDSEALSEREREIVRLVALGRSGPEIADELQIAHNTVRTHVRNAMTKSGTRSRAHLVARALGEGLVFN
ncbi:MAG TPA: LuxR C-terminal-related transcriptional regulator [Solirubrobacteraceae bacterium]|nr:LuxR C-terminal-related transcriptional regulator [Solirubrobacteraceae bacterium]